MNDSNSIKTHSTELHSNLNAIPLSDQTKFRLNEINKIKEIQERKTMSKTIRKHIAASDYIDKTFTVLSATSGRVSIISFKSVIGVPTRIASASFTLVFSLTTGIIKKLLKVTGKKKKKHNKIVMLAKSKLNSIETLMSQALIDLDISHEEFKTIANEKEKYKQMKESIRNTKSSDEKDELSESSRNIRENSENTQILKKYIFWYFFK